MKLWKRAPALILACVTLGPLTIAARADTATHHERLMMKHHERMMYHRGLMEHHRRMMEKSRHRHVG